MFDTPFSEMASIKEPMFTDTPFSEKHPMPPPFNNPICYVLPPCCCNTWLMYFAMPNVRGIPNGSVKLSAVEEAQILQGLEGNWKITPLQSGGRYNVNYTDALVKDKTIIISGGVHNRSFRSGKNRHTGAVANQTQVLPLNFLKGPGGEIYIDNIGSKIGRLDIARGEVELDNGIGLKLLLQRGWKHQGLQNPVGQSVASAVPVTTPMAVVPETEMARAGKVTAAVAAPVMTAQVFAPSLLQQITDLKKMRDEGVLTEEEFSAAKAQLLA